MDIEPIDINRMDDPLFSFGKSVSQTMQIIFPNHYDTRHYTVSKSTRRNFRVTLPDIRATGMGIMFTNTTSFMDVRCFSGQTKSEFKLNTSHCVTGGHERAITITTFVNKPAQSTASYTGQDGVDVECTVYTVTEDALRKGSVYIHDLNMIIAADLYIQGVVPPEISKINDNYKKSVQNALVRILARHAYSVYVEMPYNYSRVSAFYMFINGVLCQVPVVSVADNAIEKPILHIQARNVMNAAGSLYVRDIELSLKDLRVNPRIIDGDQTIYLGLDPELVSMAYNADVSKVQRAEMDMAALKAELDLTKKALSQAKEEKRQLRAELNEFDGRRNYEQKERERQHADEERKQDKIQWFMKVVQPVIVAVVTLILKSVMDLVFSKGKGKSFI